MERIVKGIWIPLEIWQDSALSWNEKILLMEIDSFTAQGRECYISNEFIAGLLGVSERTATRCLAHLIEVGYVRIVRTDGRKRYIESDILVHSALTNLSMQGRQICLHTNITYLNKSIDNIERDKGRSGRFVKPSVQEISDFCRERGNDIDPEEFFAFYESKGWMVGKSPMKDWRSAVITWEKSARKRTTAPRQTRRKETTFEHNLRAIDQVMGTDLHGQYYGRRDCDEQ